MSNDGHPGGGPEVTSDDPLGINKLTMDFDYLMYKISDYVESIQLQTNEHCSRQNQLIVGDIIEEVIDKNIAEFRDLLKKCDDLETHFDMLDQLAVIAATFKERLAQISKDYKTVPRSKKPAAT
ncbi:Cnl1p KNAG_0C05050 [Huiozyma naganishii CBS 8797]|uniref:Biogenesis of lysosome-related organelles complex 1 subunit CNL1 n=1 Tax=Huiozyma naganishii (strain ATCC MYA-139 / BCRC 22969 / CBS 8797 / KCTC 17520 / NBRC 10181 / NCYC 3082 / Yp74L-3) TaxID=1071383 RepID=J7S690_HUIN7|nr:hypothetical protein KNAG_0C05050 [Kazachstania naganishii CBS 8797]CCK69606.1 hypothetical protein KNAG_0C05050 [Kazachstania naganishii CBS 8797]